MAHITPTMVLFFAAICALLVVPRIVSSRRKRARPPVLQELGFRDAGPHVFDGTSYAGAALLDEYRLETHHTIVWAARGETDAGETVIFDYAFQTFTGGQGSMQQTMIAFRAPAAMACFAMRHMDAIDKNAERHLRPVAIDNRPAFNERYSVCTSDDAALRDALPEEVKAAITAKPRVHLRVASGADTAVSTANDDAVREVFTPAVLDAIEADGDKHLRIEKGGDWLFVYRWRKRAAPEEYPELMKAAVRLAIAFELKNPNG